MDLIPAILLATFGNLVLIGVLAPWLARRSGPAGPPPTRRAPPRRSSRCSPTASAPASCSPASSPCSPRGWRRGRPSSRDGGHRAQRRGLRDLVLSQRPARADPQPRDREHRSARRGLLPHLHRPRRPPPLLLRVRRHEHGPAHGHPRPERRAELRLPGGALRRSALDPSGDCPSDGPPARLAHRPHLEQLDVVAPRRSACSGNTNEKNSARRRPRWKLRPTERMWPLTDQGQLARPLR